MLASAFTELAQRSKKPLVIVLDEVDALVGDTLISLLRQIRSGYDKRPPAFPQSIILCGVRDVRDYRLHSATDKVAQTVEYMDKTAYLEQVTTQPGVDPGTTTN